MNVRLDLVYVGVRGTALVRIPSFCFLSKNSICSNLICPGDGSQSVFLRALEEFWGTRWRIVFVMFYLGKGHRALTGLILYEHEQCAKIGRRHGRPMALGHPYYRMGWSRWHKARRISLVGTDDLAHALTGRDSGLFLRNVTLLAFSSS